MAVVGGGVAARSFKTRAHLYIILEFMENGPLSAIIKPNRLGLFSEPLVSVYIAQVLRGLQYLHEQGVVHRDIKGANILTTKEVRGAQRGRRGGGGGSRQRSARRSRSASARQLGGNGPWWRRGGQALRGGRARAPGCSTRRERRRGKPQRSSAARVRSGSQRCRPSGRTARSCFPSLRLPVGPGSSTFLVGVPVQQRKNGAGRPCRCLLRTAQGLVKLADFGVAAKLGELEDKRDELHQHVVGTPYWMAPEVRGSGGGLLGTWGARGTEGAARDGGLPQVQVR